jgi:RimJ/RimL family protein N-acetyltransferase
MEWSRHTELSTTESFFSGCVERWESGTEFHWIIETSDHYDTAGCIALRIRGHAADFGYFLLPEFWGRGLASAAATLVITWLKQQPGIFRIWATTDSENLRSMTTLERLGMRREGTLRMAAVRPNISDIPRDTAVFGVSRTDF